MPDAVTRRGVLGATARIAAASAASGPLILVSGKARAAGRIFLATYGGSYADALDDVFMKPFAKETGIEVVMTGAADLAKLKAEVMAGNVEWDMVELLPTEVLTAAHNGLLQPIDYGVVNVQDVLYPDAKQTYSVSVFTYTGGIAYDTTRQPGGRHPSTWPEFWDVKNFPGLRGLRSRPNDTLEIAMLAAGTPPKDVYPIDVDRAFKILDEIKPHVAKWIDTAPQSLELVQTHEVDFSYTFNGRVFAADNAGAKLGYSMDQVLIFLNSFCVPKGAKNAASTMKLLNFMMRPDRQAAFCEKIAYMPVTVAGMELVSPDVKKNWVPDPKNPRNLTVNSAWWGEPGRFAELTARFKTWLLS
ncbi:MAG: ABC transporter substrate-binding protein [Acidisphaera sp.]|nr:ABC transporter substrate-binding protein [Acidisphaera sp.]